MASCVVTHDGLTLWLSLDGLEVGSFSLLGAVDVASMMAVGARLPGAGNPFIDGLLDDVRIVQRALLGSEIAAIAAGES